MNPVLDDTSVDISPAQNTRRVRRDAQSTNALVFAGITAALKNVLENGMVEQGVTAHLGDDFSLSALPPDRITTGSDEKPQINLFLYQVRPKGLDAPGRYAPPESRAETFIAYELFYLLTAYGSQDFHIEVLLGTAMERLRDTPLLLPPEIEALFRKLGNQDSGRLVLPAFVNLAASPLAGRVIEVRISPHVLAPEEMLQLWSALQARFRPSATYRVLVKIKEGTL